jgi:hypothetical protein
LTSLFIYAPDSNANGIAMLQFALTILLLTALGWVVTAAISGGTLTTILCFAAMAVAAWFLQTDAEKEATKKWWYDRL